MHFYSREYLITHIFIQARFGWPQQKTPISYVDRTRAQAEIGAIPQSLGTAH
jgi:hypothetical protein